MPFLLIETSLQTETVAFLGQLWNLVTPMGIIRSGVPQSDILTNIQADSHEEVDRHDLLP